VARVQQREHEPPDAQAAPGARAPGARGQVEGPQAEQLSDEPLADLIERAQGRLDLRLGRVEPHLRGGVAPLDGPGEEIEQAPVAEGVHLQRQGDGLGIPPGGLVDPMVEHQHIHLLQQGRQLILLAAFPVHLPQGDLFSLRIQRAQGGGVSALPPGGEGDHPGAAAMPAPDQGLPQGAAGSRDGHRGEGRGGGDWVDHDQSVEPPGCENLTQLGSREATSCPARC